MMQKFNPLQCFDVITDLRFIERDGKRLLQKRVGNLTTGDDGTYVIENSKVNHGWVDVNLEMED
jgi:hypothetical protein